MLGTHRYTSSGSRIPPPPRTTPKRCSSVCRTPTRRFNPSELNSDASRRRNHAGDRRRGRHNKQMVSGGDFSERSPDVRGRNSNHPRRFVDDRSTVDSKAPSQLRQESKYINQRYQQPQQDVYNGQLDTSAFRSSRYTGSGLQGGRREEYQSTTTGENNNYKQDRYSRVQSELSTTSVSGGGSVPRQRPARSMSSHRSPSRAKQSISDRLRRSLSSGQISQQSHVHKTSVVGTEILAPMPRLQGVYQSSTNRDRRTIERFIQFQPQESQAELREMLREYRGREEALCKALTDAYGDSWDAAVKGISAPQMTSLLGSACDRSTGSLRRSGERGEQIRPVVLHAEESRFTTRHYDSHYTSLQSTPSRPLGARGQSPSHVHSVRGGATSSRSRSGRFDDDASPHPRRQPANEEPMRNVGIALAYPDRPTGMLTPPVPHDLASR